MWAYKVEFLEAVDVREEFALLAGHFVHTQHLQLGGDSFVRLPPPMVHEDCSAVIAEA